MSFAESVKSSWTRTLLTLICLLVNKRLMYMSVLIMSVSPVGLLGVPPIMEAKHDGEGAGGQQFPAVLLVLLVLLVLVIQAVSRGQCKSVPNLGRKQIEKWKKVKFDEYLK